MINRFLMKGSVSLIRLKGNVCKSKSLNIIFIIVPVSTFQDLKILSSNPNE